MHFIQVLIILICPIKSHADLTKSKHIKTSDMYVKNHNVIYLFYTILIYSDFVRPACSLTCHVSIIRACMQKNICQIDNYCFHIDDKMRYR